MNVIRRRRWLTGAAWLFFASYSAIMCYLLFFGFSRTMRTERLYNLVPFKTIRSYIIDSRYYGFDLWMINLFGNVIAFIPFGFLIPLLFPFFARWIRIASLFIVGLLVVETIQFVCKVGSFDVDDILLNVLGGLLGFALYVGTIGRKTGTSRIH